MCEHNPLDFFSQVAGYWAAMIDLTHPAAQEWIKRVIRTEMIGEGSSVRSRILPNFPFLHQNSNPLFVSGVDG